MAASKAPGFFAQFRQSTKRLRFNLSGYNKYGLLFDDIVHETPEVTEALRRVPQTVKDARIYRIYRACQCSLTHTLLPQEQWTKYEEDVPYLQPYLEEVKRENAEKREWAAKA